MSRRWDRFRGFATREDRRGAFSAVYTGFAAVAATGASLLLVPALQGRGIDVALFIPGVVFGVCFLGFTYMAPAPLVQWWPHQPAQSTTTTPSDPAIVAAAYALVSSKLEIVINATASTITVGMRFKNVGPSHLRWEMENFRTEIEGQTVPLALYLTKRGTLGSGDDLLFQCGNNPVDLVHEIKGQLEFSVLYGPAQAPRARRSQETWRFELKPDGQGGFTTNTYKARNSDDPY